MNIQIYFDGGCEPNPGRKYGSYEILFDNFTVSRWERFDLGHGTNNEAEFESLEAALQEAICKLNEFSQQPFVSTLHVFTDSMIVKNRLTGKNRIHKKASWRQASERMFNLANRCLSLMVRFSKYEVTWAPREKNVERFGH